MQLILETWRYIIIGVFCFRWVPLFTWGIVSRNWYDIILQFVFSWLPVRLLYGIYPDSKVHGANVGPTWGQQGPGGPHVGPMNLAIWVCMKVVINYSGVCSARLKWSIISTMQVKWVFVSHSRFQLHGPLQSGGIIENEDIFSKINSSQKGLIETVILDLVCSLPLQAVSVDLLSNL